MKKNGSAQGSATCVKGKGRFYYFFFLWRIFSMSFLCLCLRIFFRRFLMTLPIGINPFLVRRHVETRSLAQKTGESIA